MESPTACRNVTISNRVAGAAGGRATAALATAALSLLAACGLVATTMAQARAEQVSISGQAPVPQGSPIPRIEPAAPPSVAPGPLLTPPPAAPSAVAPQTVDVRAVGVSGATAYPADTLARLTAGLVGPATSLAQIEAARIAVLNRYRADGFILTSVNAHLDAQGKLDFLVTEGHIASVKLSGDIGPAGVQVLRFLNKLTERQPIDTATLERYLLLAQDVPGISLRTTLRPSDEPGALTLVAEVSRQAVSGFATVDNRAYALTGPVEGLAVADFNSFSEFGERTELSLYHSFPGSQTFGQAAFEAYAGASGLKVRLYAGAGPSNPTGNLAALGYSGFTTVFGGQVSYPVIRARQQTLNVYGLFDALESTIDTNVGPDNSAILSSHDGLRVGRAGLDYASSDLWAGGERTGINTVTARLSQGLDILGASRDGNSKAARLNERTDFFKFNLDLSRTQTLFYPWDGASVGVMGLLAGQVSPNVLPPAEEFFLGGARITRGFFSGQVTGDNALAATIELQLNTPLPVHAIGMPGDINTQFYLFYDWGETWQNQKTDLNERLESAGGGARTLITKNVELDLEGVARLTRFPSGRGQDIAAVPAGAFYWRVLARF